MLYQLSYPSPSDGFTRRARVALKAPATGKRTPVKQTRAGNAISLDRQITHEKENSENKPGQTGFINCGKQPV